MDCFHLPSYLMLYLMLSPSNEMLCASIFIDLFLQESSFAKLRSLLAVPPQDEESALMAHTALQRSGSCSLIMDIIWMCQLQISRNPSLSLFSPVCFLGVTIARCAPYCLLFRDAGGRSCPFSCHPKFVLILF